MNRCRRTIKTGLLLLVFYPSLKAQVNTTKVYSDHHVHLQDSSAVELGYRLLKATGQAPTKLDSLVFDADAITGRLDRAKFESAWILSNAYWFGSPLTPIDNEYEEVKKQNDWTATQAGRYPGRLIAFMSVNPLKPYALEEIQRCAHSKQFAGLKLHFANSRVDLFDQVQVAKLQQVFALADKNRLLIVIHFRSSQTWNGPANTQKLLNELLPFAKHSKVVFAHMAGWGGYDSSLDAALELFGKYITENDSTGKNLYFDLSAVLPLNLNEHEQAPGWDSLAALNKRIRQIGTHHILFGTDWPLIEIDPYIELLNTALGPTTVQQILRNTITAD